MGRTERDSPRWPPHEGLSSVPAQSRDCQEVGRGPLGSPRCRHQCASSSPRCTHASVAMSSCCAQRPSVP